MHRFDPLESCALIPGKVNSFDLAGSGEAVDRIPG
jgi:hypothetical protein